MFFVIMMTSLLSSVTQLHAETLSTIEAHEFESTPVQKSKSGRVYLFKTEAADLPKTGNLVLIQDKNKPAMAFRVLRNDPTNMEYVATRVRRYDQTGELKLNEHYHSIEKVADLLTPPPQAQRVFDPNAKPEMGTKWADQKAPETANASSNPAPVPLMGSDGTTTPEAAAPEAAAPDAAPPADSTTPPVPAPAVKTPEQHLNVDGYDDELDSSTSPRDLKHEHMNPNGDDDEDEVDSTGLPKTQYEVDESKRLERFKHMASFGVGYFKNLSKMSLGNDSYGGLSGAYSWITDRNIYVKAKNLQDDFRLEAGFEYYSIINASQLNDNYTLFPLYLNYVYNLHVSDTATFDAYVGAQYNLVMADSNPSAPFLSKINSVQANIGVGIVYNLGPQWYLRADIGLDRLSAGLSIKW